MNLVNTELTFIAGSTKFTVQSLSAHPDFSAAAWTMNTLNPGSEDVTLDPGQTIGSITSQTVSTTSYANQTVVYVSGTSYTSDVNYQTSSQSLFILESTTSQVLPDLPCSISGTTTINYSISNYMTSIAPSWVTINSLTGVLSIVAPEVSSNTEYDLYVNSAVSGVSSSIQKLIKIIILN